jgi:hypothetical protein
LKGFDERNLFSCGWTLISISTEMDDVDGVDREDAAFTRGVFATVPERRDEMRSLEQIRGGGNTFAFLVRHFRNLCGA